MAHPIPSRVLLIPLWGVIALFAACASAEPKPPSPKVFRARRAALAKRLGNKPLLVLGAGAPISYDSFRQNNRFYYLTGVTEPNAALLMIPLKRKEILFLDPGDPRHDRWEGARLRPGRDAQKLTGFQDVRPRSEMTAALDGLFANVPSSELYLPLAPQEMGRIVNDMILPRIAARRRDPLDGGTWREDRTRKRLLEKYEGLTVKDASPTIRKMRVIKGPEEIAAMRHAGKISSRGMIAAMKAAKSGGWEYQVEAAMAHACRTAGGQGWAYAPIVGSGPNALVLHYSKNERKMKAGDLILMDAGFFWNYYAMDITRTFPVSGKFTPEQRKAYEDLLRIQIEAVNRVKPGTTLIALNQWVNGKLKAMGYGRYLAHFLGHFVGMAVHDPGSYKIPLTPGMVVTIEPGIYLDDKGFGIRIEDTVLVTPIGREVLSRGVPKDVASIEGIMKSR